jgi:lipid-binding SYLF domain-containing protein
MKCSPVGTRISFLFSLTLVAVLVVLALPTTGRAAEGNDAQERLDNSVAVLGEILNIPEEGIPSGLLKNAQGIIIIPHMMKGAFVVGASRGKGIVVRRLSKGGWSNPAFVTLTGGSIGFQIGGEATDLIMLVTSERGFQALLDDNFKIGANASAAAGPVGRHAAAATDAKLQADILSYSRSKGAFAGISLDGAGLTQDKDANRDYYGKAIDLQQITTTHSKNYPAPRLLKLLKPYTH